MGELSTLECLFGTFKNAQNFILNSTTGQVVLGFGVTYVACKVASLVKRSQRKAKWAEMSKNKVILHHFPRGKLTPNISPFCLKLETYLRMANIPYEVDTEEVLGPKGKTPWITVEGKEIGDSQLCIEYLGRKLGKDMSRHLTAEQKAIGVALQVMVDEHLPFGLAIWRYLVNKCVCLDTIQKFPAPIMFMFKMTIPKRVQKKALLQGIGRHSPEEIEGIVLKELRAISGILGKKKFMLGDEPCETDCAVFGLLTQFLWGCPGSKYERLFNDELINLREYCLRMKERFWKDWEQCLNK